MDRFGDLERRLDQQEQRSTNSLSTWSQLSAHSSSKCKCTWQSPRGYQMQTDLRKPLPYMGYLRGDNEIHVEVGRRLRHYEEFIRDDTPSLSTKLKSGRYHLGDQRVKHLVHWPSKFCSMGDNFKMPTCKDPNVFLWVQLFSWCILEENDPQVHTYMFQYPGNLMQD